MDDLEIERLRRLRGCALRVRAVARALGGRKCTLNDPVLNRCGNAAWRIARAVSGRLRAHPNARFQKSASLGILLGNSVVARVAAIGVSNRLRALEGLLAKLRVLSRELDDARALTWAADLSDSFGRSQYEIRSLIAAIEYEAEDTREPAVARPARVPQRGASVIASAMPECTVHAAGDWPYLAL
jgi:hypothetical protein